MWLVSKYIFYWGSNLTNLNLTNYSSSHWGPKWTVIFWSLAHDVFFLTSPQIISLNHDIACQTFFYHVTVGIFLIKDAVKVTIKLLQVFEI